MRGFPEERSALLVVGQRRCNRISEAMNSLLDSAAYPSSAPPARIETLRR